MENKITKPRFDRFKSLEWFINNDESYTTTIGGCGGIGSWLSLFVARGGFDIIIYDDDKIEEHNFGGQLFKTRHNGTMKVKAIAEVISEFTGEQKYHIFGDKLKEDSIITPFSFSAFDNMASRKMFFDKWKKQFADDKNAIFIDGRLGPEHFQIYCVNNTPEDIQLYEDSLFDDSEIPDLPCSAKQTSHVAAMISSLMFGYFTNHIANTIIGEVREVPFVTEFHLTSNLFL